MEETKPVQVVMLPKDTISYPSDMWQLGEYQHLYFISTNLIKKHDYYLESRYEREPFIDEADDSWEDDETDSLFGKNPEGTFKVIASTDPALNLPAIPTTWIRDIYVPSNGSIKEVKLEIQKWDTVNNHELTKKHLLKNRWVYVKSELPKPPFDDAKIHYYERLKLTPNNEVVIVDRNIDKLPYPELVKEMSEYFKDVKIVENSIDQELEDAAKEWKNKLLFLDSSLEDIADMLVNSWKSGANWRAEQSANDAIEFAEWCSSTHYRYDPVYKTWRYDADSYTSKEFYELWQQSKKK